MTETKHIISKDGTTISYKKAGSGEGLIIVHGGGRMGSDYEKLANALTDKYTVYTYDRRGRGASGKITADHCIGKECEDLIALIEATGSDHVFGHSMGGIIALETAKRYPIPQMAIYEAPVPVNNSVPTDFIPEFNKAINKKKYGRAMVLMMKGLQMHEAAKLPVWLLVMIVNVLKLAKQEKGWNERMAETLPTIITDFDAMKPLNNTYGEYKKIRAVTLLMAGSYGTGRRACADR
ncbi:MAG: hypothetical protein JWQ38_3432 [Flavipsychrobacter sp.]|nr:hypothetical protein [Flavipsychrobacter sp.]